MCTKEALKQFEATVRALWEDKKIKVPVHLAGGNEEQLIEIFHDIRKGDYVFSGHRNHWHYLLHGGDPNRLTAELLGHVEGIGKGRSGSMGTIDRSINFFASAIVGGLCAVAAGVAWALKEKEDGRQAWCFIGDGGMDTGHFYEALKYAEGWDLPLTFVIEDNDRSTCTSTRERWGSRITHMERSVIKSPKVRYYEYTPTWPHVGSNTYVQF